MYSLITSIQIMLTLVLIFGREEVLGRGYVIGFSITILVCVIINVLIHWNSREIISVCDEENSKLKEKIARYKSWM